MTQVIEFLLSKWGSKFKPQYHQKKKIKLRDMKYRIKKSERRVGGCRS
jgi:hypothetical protein